jgi:hypothetical protein
MELDEVKNLWKEENKKLENRIEFNEKFLRKMNIDKAAGEFDKFLKVSILGRNMALIYCAISLVMSSVVIEEIEYSIPGIIGGLTMLWSFIHHLSIEKPDYSNISLIELQKSICKFRIHLSSSAKYDISIVSLWLLTMVPLYLRLGFNIFVYTNPKHLSILCLLSFVVIVLTIVLSRNIYKQNELKLKRSEAYLDEIMEFEKM